MDAGIVENRRLPRTIHRGNSWNGIQCAGIFARMPDAEHFRMRARDCRALAKTAATTLDAALLEEIADELDAEADLIESREAARKGRVDSE